MIDIAFENRRGDEFRDSGDYFEALRCYRRAAAEECPLAAFKLGQMYYQGLGVARDYRLAAALFLRAAEENIIEAQRSLAVLFRYGRHVPVNPELSQRWNAIGDSAENLFHALNQTLEFIDPEIIFEVLNSDKTSETAPPAPTTESKPYIIPKLYARGYAVGEHGRSDRIRRRILGHFAPDQAYAMLENMIERNTGTTVLADLAADLQFIQKQQQEERKS